MAENYVNRIEFDALKNEVKEIKEGMKANATVLREIDKKVDIITSEIANANKIEELKIRPIHERLKKVEDNQTWIWRTLAVTIIGLIVNYIFKM